MLFRSAVADNTGNPFEGKLREYVDSSSQCAFHSGTSASFFTDYRPYPVDMALIDGVHSYSGVAKDWLMCSGRVRIIALHDIVNMDTPGVVRFWNEIKSNRFYHSFEFVDQYESDNSFLGIGLMIRKKIMSGVSF